MTCQFTAIYWNYESKATVDYNCDSKDEEVLDSGFCIFHDENYLQDKDSRKENEQNVRGKLMAKVLKSLEKREPLFCIGYFIPSIRINDIFTNTVYFSKCKFQGVTNFDQAKFSEADFSSAEFSEADFSSAEFSEADFSSAEFSKKADFGFAEFSGQANFSSAKFSEADFSSAKFSGQADFSITFKDNFNYVLFEDGKKILFGIEDLSQFSFMNTDITRVRFSDRARWGKKDKFKVVEEEMLENSLIVKHPPPHHVSLGSVMAVYRNLRENYEYRLRYDEAGKFFIKEMELKRKYREILSPDGSDTIVKQNMWPRRNLSLTGLYYHLSRYGENLLRPTLVGIAIIVSSTLFWLMQSNPIHEPSFSHIVGFSQIGNSTQWQKAFERSFADFLPLLPLGSPALPPIA